MWAVSLPGVGVLAHQGGWDEILLVALPLGLLAGLLWVADRRARRLGTGPGGHDAGDGPSGQSP